MSAYIPYALFVSHKEAPMELRYESATAADIDLIFDLNNQLICRYEDLHAIDPEQVLAWVRRKITNHIGSYTRILWQGELAGYYRLVPHGEELELDDLYILPKFQRKGIGSTVLRHCCDTDKSIMLYVFIKNQRAIALYQRYGFDESETVDATRIIMRRAPGTRMEVL
jgi:ribosomal protein S18 acetylase RimI-like enzyme